ncbi:molybdenum ABC transporter ATP-binding protein ModC [Pantoea agglomerans]|jgi:molybdate transport system ATP-binding protein|uniref:molybdenum ABC transporter ATP-binding protein ModC n=1 Tax=Enterobacter agglomerans TaxID=549 RepID=UPI000F5E48D3|nr:molybdenum ABC transporter ATP-binding protein ModC [Pantoea agglomerans]AZI50361.1 molybdenum ABC transporter ATP-binding protein ModC [Pantoea agglomerans]MBD8117055.1 molybdenum ABC transporter ATP-binding protein ModC [Pantoea agglomerans]MCL6409683.1 molybdenum ABC transporter ATP-binding protein ModC [Pantoea agglomerans]NEH19693.1 molybdenum ABC transporter ATP-binding protein ModC [Pantoea agglomerans]NQS79833.1 molybdenum ABC transporter ATP-binding protein ModC [Pantoea agglomeran
MLSLNVMQQQGDHVLEVDLQIPAKGITAIFGVSGAGKTSLINAISGLTQPQRGRIQLHDRLLFDAEQKIALPPEKRRIGYVFQDARLFPHYRVRGNLQYGMAPKMKAQFDSLVSLLGLEALLPRFPLSLSGGEKQRVAIGRALLTAPDMLLLDEPLASLDLPRKRELMPYLQKLAKQVEIPMLYVSHSLEEILQLADNVLVLDAGKVKAFGPLERVWSSSAMRPWLPVSELTSVLRVQVLEQHPDYPMTALSLGDQHIWVSRVNQPVKTPLRIRIASADVSLALQPPQHSSIRNILPAQVVELLEVGDQVEVKLRIGISELWARITPWARDELGIRPDQWLYAQIKSVSVTP